MRIILLASLLALSGCSTEQMRQFSQVDLTPIQEQWSRPRTTGYEPVNMECRTDSYGTTRCKQVSQ